MIDQALRNSFRFMLDNAGYSIPPGRAACALSLARAELLGRSLGLRFAWSPEWDDCSMTDEQRKRIENDETVYLCCLAYAPLPSGGMFMFASLGGIEVESESDSYCRVVEAELASEYSPEMVSL